jgi:hypothetical protein
MRYTASFPWLATHWQQECPPVLSGVAAEIAGASVRLLASWALRLLLRVSVDIAGVRMVKAYGRPPWLSYLKSN